MERTLGLVQRLAVLNGHRNSVVSFFIFGGLYSVTALRENNQERSTEYARHQLKPTKYNNEALGSAVLLATHPSVGARACLPEGQGMKSLWPGFLQVGEPAPPGRVLTPPQSEACPE